MDKTMVIEGVFEHQLASWKDFGPYIADHLSNSPAIIYRGQANASWGITSTIDRLEERFPTSPNHWGDNPQVFNRPPVDRDGHLRAFQEVVRGRRGVNPPSLNENEWWAMAQHHGLATPILDWTYLPFVALFFAFEEHGYVDRQRNMYIEPENRIVFGVPFHIIGEEGTEEHPAPTVFAVRREITNRLSSQAGLFMKMPEGVELEANVRARFADQTYSPEGNLHPVPSLIRIIIPNEGRVECLKYLNKMNINRMSLFADIDGAAKYINNMWELDFDTSLGAIPDEPEQRGV